MSNTTDTNQAGELYELCKEVYERTGWKPTDWQHGDENGQPLYTSDDLLEKLPGVLLTDDDPLHVRGTWIAGIYAWYENDWIEKCIADTPLKSLLKLTIALHESGELK